MLADAATVVHAFPGPAPSPTRRSAAIVAIPAVQAAAMAAGGFVAGAAVAGLAHRRGRGGTHPRARRRRSGAGRRGSRNGKVGEMVQIVGTRSLLLDVHLLGGPGLRSGR